MAITLKSCYKINHCLKGNLFVANIVAGIVNKNIKKLQNIGKTKKSTQEH